MESTVKQRLIEYLDFKNISKSEFGRRIGVSAAFVGSMRKSIQPDKIKSIAVEFPDLNTGWLLTGEGEMLKGEADTPPRRKGMIRYWVDVEATGSGVMSFDDGITGRYTDMLIPDFRECTDAINLYGDSMAPLYKSGCILILQEWKERFIDYGLIYLIITTSGYRMVKYLQPGSVPDKITCVSENREKHPPFEIELAEVARLYLVKGSIEKNTL